MVQTAALRKRNQRARDRARLGNDEYLRIERDKMRAYRASKRPPAPQQVIKDYVPMYKSPNATPISDNSISTYLSQFKKVYEHFTKKDVPDKLKNELTKVLQLKNYDNKYVTNQLKFMKDTIKFIDELN